VTDPYLDYAPARRDESPPVSVSDKSRAVAVALGFITGVFGGHRYYAGKIKTGLLMTFTFGGMGIWWLVDMIMLVTGEFKDGAGRRITQWAPHDMAVPANVTAEQFEAIHAELDRIRHELMDVHERIDFQERMLQRGRE
jgi:TM2 domain-containing membrane protein YozV